MPTRMLVATFKVGLFRVEGFRLRFFFDLRVTLNQGIKVEHAPSQANYSQRNWSFSGPLRPPPFFSVLRRTV